MVSSFYDDLTKRCTAYGFVAKGKTFFRLIGDGVLQVIKCKYQRNLGGDIISVGLFSMYGPMLSQYFTASGCIPRYHIADCYAQNHRPLVFALPPHIQLEMLDSQVLPWLNSIDTQKELIRAMNKLDPRWHDKFKIGPYLACGELNHAKKVIREVLGSSVFGINRQYQEEPNGLLFLKPDQEFHDLQLLLEIVDQGDADKIQTYLRDQYARNMRHVRFYTRNCTY